MNSIKNIFISVLLLLTIATILFQVVAFNQNWYEAEFKILKIPTTPTTTRQLENLLAYLRNREPLDNSFYTEREILHLQDIQNLTLLSKRVTWGVSVITGVLLILVLAVQHGKEFIKTLFFSNVTALMLYATIMVLLYLQFDFLFTLFHQIVFNNDYWMLDPQTENLINIFPPQLFADLLQQVFGLAILCHLALFCTTGFVLVITMLQRSREI